MKKSTQKPKSLSEIKLVKSTYYNPEQTTKELVQFISQAEVLSCSDQCLTFEEKFAAYQGRKYGIMMNSGSSANLAMIQALLNMGTLHVGDHVGFSALTWSTNVMPLIQLGLKPVPIDVDLDTLNISSSTLDTILKRFDLKMLFVTNLLGFCGDWDKIEQLCQSKGVLILEDNCESLGSVYQGRKLGNWSLASSCSFYVGHHMSTVEGGIVCTDDKNFAQMLRIVRAHGWDRNLSREQQTEIRKLYNVNSTFYSRYTFYDLGYNLRPTEIAGFLGNIQITYLDEIIEKRVANFDRLSKAIYTHTDRYYPVRTDHMDLVSNFAIPVVCRDKDHLKTLVKRCNGKVEIRPIVGGDMTKQPFFIKHAKEFTDVLMNSNASLIHDQGLYFGNNPELTDEELDLLEDIFVS